MNFQPYPFHWVPAAGQRHASTDARPSGGYPTGMEVATLCGCRLDADNSELAWFWNTCPVAIGRRTRLLVFRCMGRALSRDR
ncbi:zinc finger protein [Saccharopolyspora shandongensis]|uniref:zinc finger protein n=1 Tax=Saccharopolyspora shandongensis TaxID=418495 RepID=UPI0033D7A1D0